MHETSPKHCQEEKRTTEKPTQTPQAAFVGWDEFSGNWAYVGQLAYSSSAVRVSREVGCAVVKNPWRRSEDVAKLVMDFIFTAMVSSLTLSDGIWTSMFLWKKNRDGEKGRKGSVPLWGIWGFYINFWNTLHTTTPLFKLLTISYSMVSCLPSPPYKEGKGSA